MVKVLKTLLNPKSLSTPDVGQVSRTVLGFQLKKQRYQDELCSPESKITSEVVSVQIDWTIFILQVIMKMHRDCNLSGVHVPQIC